VTFRSSLRLAWGVMLIASCRNEQVTSGSGGITSPREGAARPSETSVERANSRENPTDASLIELIANPERYRGRWVRVIGYAVMEFEGTAIFIHEEDYSRAILRNGLWLDVDLSGPFAFPGPGYAIVEARFDPDQPISTATWPYSRAV
jgi:hypothetical protein